MGPHSSFPREGPRASLTSVSDGHLLRVLRELVTRDQQAEAELLRVLGEVNVRRLYLERGYPSLYAYCTEVLHMSEAVAYQRIQVAKATRRFPALLASIRNGELHLSGARLLAPHLTAENEIELLELARHKSKRAIEEALADRTPKPDVPALVRRLPDGAPAQQNGPERPRAKVPVAHRSFPRRMPQRQPRPEEPLGQERYRVQFTANRDTWETLREARALLRHQIPDGDLGEIFARALTLLVKDVRRTKFAEVDRPRTDKSSTESRARSRTIPAGIRREVKARDDGRCAFVASNGHRCGAREFLEFHHREPWGKSRRHSVDNLELRCRAHNQWAAESDFGAGYMRSFQRSDRCELAPGPVEGYQGKPGRPD